MIELGKIGPKEFGIVLLTDGACAAPFLGNALRVVMAEDLGVDYFAEEMDINDQIYTVGTVASFIPAMTIIAIKEKVSQLRR